MYSYKIETQKNTHYFDLQKYTKCTKYNVHYDDL